MMSHTHYNPLTRCLTCPPSHSLSLTHNSFIGSPSFTHSFSLPLSLLLSFSHSCCLTQSLSHALNPVIPHSIVISLTRLLLHTHTLMVSPTRFPSHSFSRSDSVSRDCSLPRVVSPSLVFSLALVISVHCSHFPSFSLALLLSLSLSLVLVVLPVVTRSLTSYSLPSLSLLLSPPRSLTHSCFPSQSLVLSYSSTLTSCLTLTACLPLNRSPSPSLSCKCPCVPSQSLVHTHGLLTRCPSLSLVGSLSLLLPSSPSPSLSHSYWSSSL